MKKNFVFIPIALLILIFMYGCLTFWGAKRTIRLKTSTPINDYQVMILLGRNNFNYNAAKPDGSDVRAFDTRGNILYHWIENWNPYGISTVWVRIPEAGTERIVIKSGNPGDTNGSDGTKVFDPVTWETFKTGWVYSGTIPGRVSGWEDPLTEFDLDVETWTPVDIDTDFVGECDDSRWFIRKEVFIARGEVNFSGLADDDVIWSLIASDELYRKVGGNELDSDGRNPGDFTGKIIEDKPFGHYIWAGRGQEGLDAEFLRMTSVDMGLLYMRKIISTEDKEKILKEEITGEEPVEEEKDTIEEEPGGEGIDEPATDTDTEEESG